MIRPGARRRSYLRRLVSSTAVCWEPAFEKTHTIRAMMIMMRVPQPRDAAGYRSVVSLTEPPMGVPFCQASAGSMLGSSWCSGTNSPRCTARITSTASPANGGLPVSR